MDNAIQEKNAVVQEIADWCRDNNKTLIITPDSCRIIDHDSGHTEKDAVVDYGAIVGRAALDIAALTNALLPGWREPFKLAALETAAKFVAPLYSVRFDSKILV